MAAGQLKYTALYERLSRDDDLQGESNSIRNQKYYLEDYARSQGFRNLRHFVDDGYTGTNFNRPQFKAMIAEIEAGNIETVIVKDMSRLGRNYLQVGYYTEMMFPDKGVRFIAVNNNIDSAVPTENDFTPFLNIMNEWYARDTSKKIRAVFKARMKNGNRVSGSIPYGYTRKPGDKQTLYVDPEAADVVRRIFQMAGEGVPLSAIADTLWKDKVLIPSAYSMKYHPESTRCKEYHDPCRWSNTTVSYILDRQEYLGHTILGKTVIENFKTKKRRMATQDELMFFPNTHEPIIDQEMWDKAQAQRKRRPKQFADGTFSHRLSGLIYCADCGSRMSYSSPEAKRNSPVQCDSNSSFQCSHYRNVYQKCTSHFIKTSTLEIIILNAIRTVASYVLENEEAFLEELKIQCELQKSSISADDQKELVAARGRMTELDSIIKSLYEKSVTGDFPERQLQKLMTQYDEEQAELEKRIAELEKKIEEAGTQEPETDRFLKLVHRYQKFDELTDTMLYEFIDKVAVHAATGGRTVYRQQQIDVYFNFIGQYTVPLPVITEEERKEAIDAEQQQKKEAKCKRSSRRRQERIEALRNAAESGDLAAKEEYEQYLAKRRENSRKNYARKKALREADPEYIAKMAEKERATAEKMLKIEQEKQERAEKKRKATLSELKEKAAAGDPEAIRELEERRAIGRERSRRSAERKKQKAAEDPEYAEYLKERQAEYNRRQNEKRKTKLADLKEKAEAGDSDAQDQLAKRRKYYCEATKKSYRKMCDDAANGDPQAQERHEAFLRSRREAYHNKKSQEEEKSA